MLFDPLISSCLSPLWDLESLFLTDLQKIKVKCQSTRVWLWKSDFSFLSDLIYLSQFWHLALRSTYTIYLCKMLESNLLLHSKRSPMGHSLKSCLKREIINENKITYLWTLIKSTASVYLLHSTNAKPHIEFFNPKPRDFPVHTEENSCKGCFTCWDLAQIKELQAQAVPQCLTAKRKMKCTQAGGTLAPGDAQGELCPWGHRHQTSLSWTNNVRDSTDPCSLLPRKVKMKIICSYFVLLGATAAKLKWSLKK